MVVLQLLSIAAGILYSARDAGFKGRLEAKNILLDHVQDQETLCH